FPAHLGGHPDILRHGAVHVDAGLHQLVTEDLLALDAHVAVPAADDDAGGDPVPHLQVFHGLAHFHHVAGELMAGGEGIGHRPGACQDGAVAAADAHGADLDDHVGVPEDGVGDLFHGEA